MKKSMMFFGILLAVVFGAVLPAHADYWAWNGSATSPSYWDDLSLWLKSGTTTDFKAYNHNIMEKWSSGQAFAAGWDNTITFRNVSILSNETSKVGVLTFSAGSPQAPIVFAAERDDYGIWSNAPLDITGDGEADPCLLIRSGTYRFTDLRLARSKGTNGTINVSGGTLATTNTMYIGTAGIGYMNVSGGVVSSENTIGVGVGGTGFGALIAWGNAALTEYAARRSVRLLTVVPVVRMLFGVGFLTAVYFLAPLTPWDRVPMLCGAAVGLTVPMIFFTVRLARRMEREKQNEAHRRGEGE